MSNRVATTITRGSADAVVTTLLRELELQLEGERPAFVAVFASTEHELGAITGPLAARGLVVVGASTAGELDERGDQKGSVAMFAVAGELRATVGLGRGLRDDPSGALTRALEPQPAELAGFAHRTAVTLLDPLAGNGEEVTLMLAERLGPEQPLAGGAAGDDLQMRETRVAVGAEVASDAIVVMQLFSKAPLAIGVAHGHRSLSEPLRVTRATGGAVHEIDGKPAWDVWRERTRAAAAARGIDVDRLAKADETPFLLQFEAGLSLGDDALKIRAPLSRDDDGSIQFAAAVPEGSVIRITESDAPSQVDSAVLAARRARAGIDGPVAGALVFDCICRKLILGERFGEAVRAMSGALGGARLAGFETYGEIALSAGDMSAFHNTTSVVLAFPR
jgi:hypothetical protein